MKIDSFTAWLGLVCKIDACQQGQIDICMYWYNYAVQVSAQPSPILPSKCRSASWNTTVLANTLLCYSAVYDNALVQAASAWPVSERKLIYKEVSGVRSVYSIINRFSFPV